MEFKWLNEGQAKTEGDIIKIMVQSVKKELHRSLCAMHHFIIQKSPAIL